MGRQLTFITKKKPLPAPSSGGGGGGSSSGGKKVDYIGVLKDGDQTLQARRYGRHKISDLPGTVPSARLELHYVDKALPTGNVALIEVTDFATLDPADWGIAEIGVIMADALTPSLAPGKRSIDVTTAYNAAKAAGRPFFAWKLQYELEDEAVGLGRWYRIGATGDIVPVLVLTVTAGRDLRVELLATPLVVDLDYEDGLGDRAAVLIAGDGDAYPPLGEGVAIAATLTGLLDDVIGTYTGVPAAPIQLGPDIMHFGWRSATEGNGLTTEEIDTPAFVTARARLADWFPLRGGFTEPRDVRDWMTSIARCCRSFTYQDQLGRETIHTEPVGGSGLAPVRVVKPWEHGALRLFPLPASQDSMYPISRVDVYYGWDFLGLDGWQGHALIDHHETTPPDTERAAQAVEAFTRYGVRELGGEPAAMTPDTGYEWVPMDEPGRPTGVRIRDLLWDRARRRTMPVQAGEVELLRFALAWPLMTEFDLESDTFPSAAARRPRNSTPWLGSTGTVEDTYRSRRARCTVRAQPRLLAESAGGFPVLLTIQIEAWDTP